MTTLLEVKDLHSSYNKGAVQALSAVSFEVKTGEVVAIIGANGAGKTTTLLSICGLLRESHGLVEFENNDLLKIPAHQIVNLGLAHVPEGRKIFSRLSVLENLQLGAYIRKKKECLKEELNRIYTLFPILKERSRQSAGTLSGGEQQMLAIARALMSKPKMLLLDEPSMGIAPILVQNIFSALRELNKQGMTILLVEQNANLALKFSERAYVLESGKVVLADLSKNLLANPRVQEAYLGA